MSKIISQEKSFLHLLLNSTKDQSRALLYTITPKQVLVISEIVHNLLHLPLPTSVQPVIHKRRKALQRIGNKTSSLRTKSAFIKKHMTLLLNTLQLVKLQLQELIE